MKLGVKDKNVHFCTFRNQANFTRAGINGLIREKILIKPEVNFLKTVEPFIPGVVNSRQMIVFPVDHLKCCL